MSRVRTILCAADPGASEPALECLASAVEQRDVDAIAVVGDLSAGAAPDGYRALLHAIAATSRPAYWVPGPGDAPLDAYIRASHAVESTHPTLHGVHGTAALTPDGHLVVAGLGGEIDDHASAQRDEGERLRYPRQEAEYRLKVLEELGEHERILLFSSQGETVEELIKTYRPRLAVTTGERGVRTLGKKSLVVAPGSLADGHYAVVDLQTHEVELAEPAGAHAAR